MNNTEKPTLILPDAPFLPGTIKPEDDYAEFNRLGAKLGLPCPQVHICVESRASDGSLVKRVKHRSRTFNRNYWNWLFLNFGCLLTSALNSSSFGAGFLNNKKTDGTVSGAVNFSRPPDGSGAISDVTQGIVVGTGTTAESFEGYVLITPVANGTGAGQMSYQAVVGATATYNAGTKVWTVSLSRVLNNNSAGTIVVAETAIYGSNNASSSKFMIMRDLLGATVSVLAAGQLTVTYTFTLTFPA